MREFLLVDMAIAICSACLFFFVSFSGYRHRTRLAAGLSVVATLGLVVIDRVLWAKTTFGLLDHITCAVDPRALPCSGLSPPTTHIAADPPAAIAPRPRTGLPSETSLKLPKSAAATQPEPLASMPAPRTAARPPPGLAKGALAPAWRTRPLYGYATAFPGWIAVNITGQPGDYRVSIPDDFGFACDLIADRAGDPHILRNCQSARVHTSGRYEERVSTPDKQIVLTCAARKADRLCEGRYRVTFHSTDRLHEEADRYSSIEFPIKIAHR